MWSRPGLNAVLRAGRPRTGLESWHGVIHRHQRFGEQCSLHLQVRYNYQITSKKIFFIKSAFKPGGIQIFQKSRNHLKDSRRIGR